MSTRNRISNEELVKTYQPLVRSIALGMLAKLPASIDIEDLFQAGLMGLLDAATRFKAGQGTELSTFAATRIRGAMIDLLRIDDPLSRHSRKSHRKAVDTTERLSQKFGRKPTAAAVAEEMDIPLGKLHHLQAQVCRFGVNAVHIQGRGSESSEWGQQEEEISIADRESSDSLFGDEDPFQAFAIRQILEHIYQSSAKLTVRQHEALGHYLRANTLGGTAEAMNITKSRVCQLWNELVRKLRVILCEDHGYDVPPPNSAVDFGAVDRQLRSDSKKNLDAKVPTDEFLPRG